MQTVADVDGAAEGQTMGGRRRVAVSGQPSPIDGALSSRLGHCPPRANRCTQVSAAEPGAAGPWTYGPHVQTPLHRQGLPHSAKPHKCPNQGGP